MELWQFLAHRHWLTFNILGRKVRLCARCSGYFTGLLSVTILSQFFDLIFFKQFNVTTQILLCSLLMLPLTFDWITQSWGLRESKNSVRFITGAVLGIGMFYFSSIEIAVSLKRVVYLSSALTIVLIGFLGVNTKPSSEYIS